MPIPLRPRKPRHQHIRTELPDHPHNIRQRNVMSLPLLKRLLRIFRIPKIRHPRKTLLYPVITIRGQHLQRPQHAQLIEQIASRLVLPALAARQRHQSHGRALAPRLQRQHAAVFVIRMRIHLQQSRCRLQPPQRLLQPQRPRILRQRINRTDRLCLLRPRRSSQHRRQQERAAHSPGGPNPCHRPLLLVGAALQRCVRDGFAHRGLSRCGRESFGSLTTQNRVTHLHEMELVRNKPQDIP